MKVLYWAIGIVVGVPVLLAVVIFGASELGGEVVTLDRAEADGSASQIRVWIVDEDGQSWIEHGDPDSHWISRLPGSPEVTLTRDGRTTSYLGIPDPESHDRYHQLRRKKYGWADQVVGMFDGEAECAGVPVRLHAMD